MSAVLASSAALDRLVDRVREAAAAPTPLAIRGGGTKTWYGHRVVGTALDVREHAGVVDYEPSELVLVARAGTPLREIESVLAEQRQMLAFEPPHFTPYPAPGVSMDGREATLGGAIATGLSGPRRMAVGSARDFVLGARVIDGKGRHLSFGGKVMKNVAGYDVSRALVGSLGMLGVITEVSLKVLPRPEQRVTIALMLDEAAALDQLNAWAALPIAITASAWRPDRARSHKGRLVVRLEGSEAAVQSGIRRLGGMDVEYPDAFWTGLREQTDEFFTSRAPDAPLWRIAVPSVAPPLDAKTLRFDDQLIEWGGALRWIASKVDGHTVREAIEALGGHATLWRAADDVKAQHGVFTPLSPALLAIHRRLKAEFDPHGLFNPGRMYPELAGA